MQASCLLRIGSAVALTAALPVAAQALPGETLHVFAERAPLLRVDGTQAITVVTRAQIEARQPASLPDLLREVAGVHVDRLGNPGGIGNLYIRGGDPNHTVVLIDGVRVNDPTDVRGGSYDLTALSIEDIERVEILRGSSSAQFGADAMGGIVNIVTRAANGPRMRASAEAGGLGLRRLGLGGSWAGVAALGASWMEDGRESDGGSARDASAHGSLAWSGAAGDLRFLARHLDSERRAFPESSGGVRLAELRELERRDTRESSAALSYHYGSALSLRASHFERREDRDSPGIAGGAVPKMVSDTIFRRDSFAAQGSGSVPRWTTTFVAGVEAAREAGARTSVLDLGQPFLAAFERERDTRAGFVQAETHPVEDLRLLAAVRRDRVDLAGSRTSRSLGLRYRVREGSALRAHWSEGFKPPSFFALSDPLVGNPGLKPETSQSVEVGWDYAGGATRLQATAFRSRFIDLVDFDAEAFHMVNRPGARSRGAEAQAGLPLAGVDVDAAFTYANAESSEGVPLRNRPRVRASLAAGTRWGAWSARAAVIHQSESIDFSIPTGDVRLPGFTVLDLVLRWTSGPWSAAIALDNAADRRYETFVGFTAPGRRLRFSIGMAL